MDMQAAVNALNNALRDDRTKYHLTLGQLIAALDEIRRDMPVRFDTGSYPRGAHSYRGYYSDLAFEPTTTGVTVADLLGECLSVLDTCLQGYKGGDYLMDEDTPLWEAEYGCGSGRAIMGVSEVDGSLVLQTKAVE